MNPKRIQRKRTKGWRKPENTVNVTRPGKWGNPYKVVKIDNKYYIVKDYYKYRSYYEKKESAVRDSILFFRVYINNMITLGHLDISELRGKNLMCWCVEGNPCHGDVLLEMANENEGESK